MKITFLLLIVCLTEIYANDREILRECFREYGEDYGELSQDPKMTAEEAVRRVTSVKFGCISACYLEKQLKAQKEEGDIADLVNIPYVSYLFPQLVDPIPIRKRITDSLNETPPGFTDAEIATYKNEVNRCIEEAKTDDCKLIKCLKPWSSETRIGRFIGIP